MLYRTIDIHFNDLVVGGNLAGASYAFNKKIPLIFTRLDKPYIPIKRKNHSEWNRFHDLMFIHSFANLVPFAGLINNLRLVDNNTLKATTRNNLLINITFNNLFIADDHNFEGLSISNSRTSDEVEIYDFFHIIATTFPEEKISYINEDNLKLVEYYTYCIGPRSEKRIYSFLKIKESEINNFEFSTHSVNLFLKKNLKKYGYKGRWDKTNKHFKALVLKFVKRDIVYKGKNIYEPISDNIHFLLDEEPTTYEPITIGSINIV